MLGKRRDPVVCRIQAVWKWSLKARHIHWTWLLQPQRKLHPNTLAHLLQYFGAI
jgi:hypothetical protein